MKSVMFIFGLIGIAMIIAIGLVRINLTAHNKAAEEASRPQTHVIILLGQSNMSGAATDIDPVIDHGDPRILQYADDMLIPAVEPLTHWIGVSGGGPGLAFAREYLKSLPARDRIVPVPSAISGVGFSTPDMSGRNLSWNVSEPDDAHNVYLPSIRHIQAALAAVNGKKQLDGALVNLGGTDGLNYRPASEYRQHLEAFISDLRKRLNEPNLSIVLGPSRPDIVASHDGYAAVNRVQQSAPQFIDNVAYIEGAAGEQYYIPGDPVHYNMAGHRLMGVRYAQALTSLKD